MSTISASTTSTTAYKVTADTTGTLVFQTGASPTTAVTIDTSQNMGIGSTSPAGKLTVKTGTNENLNVLTGGSGDMRLSALNDAASTTVQLSIQASPLLFRGTGGSEVARIDSSGNFLVGTTSSTGSGASSGKIVVQFNGTTYNGIYYDDTRTSAGSDVAAIFGRGSTVVGRLDTTLTSLTLTNLSDQRVKTNIQDSASAMSLVGSVKVRQFDWTIDESHEDFGFVAQELNEVLPQAVSVGKTEEEMWGVNFVKLVPILTKAIQEQQAIIETLTNRITALEAK